MGCIMTLDEILPALFPAGHDVQRGPHGTIDGTARLDDGTEVAVLGITGGEPLGIDAAIRLASHVLSLVRQGKATPLVLLVDTSSQLMARRDELLGLNEYLAHLAKSLHLASASGHRTVGILHGAAAAGAFIATALATDTLVAVPGAEPSVMDLPSIARVTKIGLEKLQEMAASTPIFAPGIGPLTRTGAVALTWDDPASFARQLRDLLREPAPASDTRDRLGVERGGRLKAAPVASRVVSEAQPDEPG